jgi:hypothetical protein
MTTERPTKVKSLALMQLAMPPFENFLEHGDALRGEAEKAGVLTDDKAALFDEYRNALLTSRSEYEDQISALICEQFSEEEVDLLISFYSGPMSKVVDKAFQLASVVDGIGTAWRTKVLERCPDTWKMMMEGVGEWSKKNMPESWDVNIPDSPQSPFVPSAESMPAEELINTDLLDAPSVPFLTTTP